VNYDSPFAVQTPDAADIASVVLVRPGTPTHAFDMEQRLVGLTFTAGSGVLTVTAPSNGNIAPPGYYMLFVLNSAGVPSVAVRETCHCPTQSGAGGHDYQPGGQCHRQSRTKRVVLRGRNGFGRQHQRI
jgi:hypothetical protein